MDKIVVAQDFGVLPHPENTLASILVSEQEVVVVTTDSSGVVVTGIMGPPGVDGITRVSDMSDIDKTGLVDGALLVYSSAVDKWRATDSIEPGSIFIDPGEF